MSKLEIDSHFKNFAGNLELALSKYEELDKPLIVHQREQIRELVRLETLFRETLIADHRGDSVYKDFVKFICDKKKNILAARPYFRERQETFTKFISGALKKRKDKSLYRFKFNWSFINFVLKSRKWAPKSQISLLAKKINKLRTELLEQNLPLAISQARIFWSNTPKSHLSYMDIVQIQCQGLLLAIDKFVPPNDKRMSDKASLLAFKSFRAVAIGIMARDRVNAYSETLIHFFPGDRAKIYRALKALRRVAGEPDMEALTKKINKELDPKYRTNPSDLAGLLAAGSTVSADYNPDQEGETVAESYPDAEDKFQSTEDNQALNTMLAFAKRLTVFEQKLLKMKGLSF
jgi:DNA-directed RNA polymerase specialized sigma subunit